MKVFTIKLNNSRVRVGSIESKLSNSTLRTPDFCCLGSFLRAEEVDSSQKNKRPAAVLKVGLIPVGTTKRTISGSKRVLKNWPVESSDETYCILST